ncbi:lysine transporter LysE [Apibacter muscae]|uniref:LysE family translocator n=1 Tax=Apibacter muscae TaxID=2509004 RepID=UPI0011ADB486|nr:LysE family transporter [Apibacter muscae]TWP24726.1 lysine transporter LysE [Apibacter muscae]
MILSAIILGLVLSLILIGPVFFLLIETSLTRGVKPALALEAGVVMADLLCIYIAHRGSTGLSNFIKEHPSIYMLAGFIIFVYGLYNYFSKVKVNFKSEVDKIATSGYLKTFLNGFLLNLVNIGVIVFWLTTVVLISTQYPKSKDFYIYIIFMMSTMILIDFLKIFLANRFQNKLTGAIVFKLKRIVGIALIVCGIIIFTRSFIKTDGENSFEIIENRLNHTFE